MKGLRMPEKESKKFLKFFQLVQSFAEKHKSVYFLDTGEGREIFTKEYEGEDLSGWLIPEDLVKEFEIDFNEGREENDRWDIYYRFAEWEKKDDGIIIKFVDYGIYED
ncbi:MAG: hypothetical protein M0P94_04270 [Candidatus Absconditabacterales bacterium]|nr:hypothetical protein [Candidatus Absconditabacterales bacterium]